MSLLVVSPPFNIPQIAYIEQEKEFGSGTFSCVPDPELFVSNTDPAKIKGRITVTTLVQYLHIILGLHIPNAGTSQSIHTVV